MLKLRAFDFLKISPGWYSEAFFCVPIGDFYALLETLEFFENIPLVGTFRTYDSFVHVGGSNVFDMA